MLVTIIKMTTSMTMFKMNLIVFGDLLLVVLSLYALRIWKVVPLDDLLMLEA